METTKPVKFFRYTPEIYQCMEDVIISINWRWIFEVPDNNFFYLLEYFSIVADNVEIYEILCLPYEFHKFMLCIFMVADQGISGSKFQSEYLDGTVKKYLLKDNSLGDLHGSKLQHLNELYLKGIKENDFSELINEL